MNTNYYVDTTYGYNAADSVNGLIGGMLIFVAIMWLICLAVSILMLVSMWKIFKKAGKPGWASLVPIYNIYTMCQIADKQWWYILLLCVPIANIYAMFVIYDGIAKKLGKTSAFAIGMMFLPMIFFPILAFSKDVVEEEVVSGDTYNEAPYITASVNEPVSYSAPVQNVNEPVMTTEDTRVVYTEPVQTIAEPVVMSTQNETVANFEMSNMNETSIYNQTVSTSEPFYQAPTVNSTPTLESNNVTAQEVTTPQNVNVTSNTPVFAQNTAEPVANEMNAYQTNDVSESANETGYQTPVFDTPVNQVSINTAPEQNIDEIMTDVNDNIDQVMQDVSYSNVTEQSNTQIPQQNENTTLNTQRHTSLWSNNDNNTQM